MCTYAFDRFYGSNDRLVRRSVFLGNTSIAARQQAEQKKETKKEWPTRSEAQITVGIIFPPNLNWDKTKGKYIMSVAGRPSGLFPRTPCCGSKLVALILIIWSFTLAYSLLFSNIMNSRQQTYHLSHKLCFDEWICSKWSQFFQTSQNWCSLEHQSFLDTLREERL